MSKYFLFAAIASLAMVNSASASVITWQTPHNISGASDVNTTGTTFGTWAPGSYSANPYTVNGVDFYSTSNLPGLTFNNFWAFQNVFGSPGTSDANYNYLLQNAIYDGTDPATVSWNGLTVGHTYLVELWTNDTRSGVESRTETFSGSASDVSSSVAFQTAATGAGQYIVGTFDASTVSQTITLQGNQAGQLNLIQVRDITPPPSLPEPATLSLFGLGALAMLRRPLKKPA